VTIADGLAGCSLQVFLKICTSNHRRFDSCDIFSYIAMGIGAVAEPLVVVTLLFGGTWVNRNKDYKLFGRRRNNASSPRSTSPDSESGRSSISSSASLLGDIDEVPKWRTRELQFFGLRKEVTSPNSRRFKDYFLSRLLRKFPFLVEAWYWALIYWVCTQQHTHI
jgi:hypothetical protein